MNFTCVNTSVPAIAGARFVVSESGVRTAEDIQKVRESQADAVLIGEALMRVADKKAKLKELKGLM